MSDGFPLSFTPSGIAAMWLRGHAPDAGEKEIASLAKLMEGLYLDGMKAGFEESIRVTKISPTTSAVEATLEAEIVDLKRHSKEKLG